MGALGLLFSIKEYMDNLKDKKLVELRELAKEMGIESISKYRKDELIKLIEEEEANRNEEKKKKQRMT